MTKAVENFAPKLIILTVQRALFTRRHLLYQFLLLILILGAVGGSARAELDVRNLPAKSVGVGSRFAISDFDGDLQPDLASIQAGRNNSGETDYWIQVHLSTAGRQSIRVVAPSGGLQIEARDVNGDHAIDLVISTAGRREPVAILLNDGHGTFSRCLLYTSKYSQMVDSFAVFRCGKKVFERTYPHDYAKIYGKEAGERGPYNERLTGRYNYFDPAWHPYYHGTDLHTMQSISKTVTSVIIGAAIQRGDFKAGLDTPVLKYFDTSKGNASVKNVDERKRRMTLRLSLIHI